MHTFDGVDLAATLLAAALIAAIVKARRDERRAQVEDWHARRRRVQNTIDRIDEQTYRNDLRDQLEHAIRVEELLAA